MIENSDLRYAEENEEIERLVHEFSSTLGEMYERLGNKAADQILMQSLEKINGKASKV